MSQFTTAADLTARDKRLIFWASFLALTAAGVGFSFRVAMGGTYGTELGLTNHQVSQIFGASLWPIAITMIGFSLLVDRTGYKLPMYGAFALQAISGVATYFATSYGMLYAAALCAGLGHGIVEAVINPVCAAIYPKEKTKALTILHAAWPAGLVAGTLAIIWTDGAVEGGLGWQMHALWIVVPAVLYAVMYAPVKMPVDERVQAGVPYKEMLRQVGFLSAALASFLVVYEVGNQATGLFGWNLGEMWFETSIGIGLGIGILFGLMVKGIGKPLFFAMCLLMIPVATAELGTDQWIKKLMTPVLDNMEINAAYALVFSATIMLVLRVFAGGILSVFSPPSLLAISGIFSAVGLYWLSTLSGSLVFVAFVIYALGQTYYWPCVLGFVSERYPQGGALTLNTVSAIGLLSAGIIGGQLLGIAFDKSIHGTLAESQPALTAAATEQKDFLGLEYSTIDPPRKDAYIAALETETEQTAATEAFMTADNQAGRDVLAYSVVFPLILVIAFGLIALWFKSRGGYRPIELVAANEE